jgi:hypothetical protein
MNYLPESVLLNHVFIPFYQLPVKQIFNCSEHFKALEIGPNGLTSVINLSIENTDGNNELIFPFINLSKFDTETKEWFWYDDQGFPYRIYRTNDAEWAVSPMWDFGNYYDFLEKAFDPTDLLREEGGKELGFYANTFARPDSIKMYTGAPIIITINGEILADKTVYGQQTDYNLTSLMPEQNKEFYYDPSSNRIYTNQNLNEFDAKQIKIYCYTVSKEVSIKCRMKANQGKDAYMTPTVDYFITKLNGQYLRG